jgi:RNA polymerase-binding transcription factor DksA
VTTPAGRRSLSGVDPADARRHLSDEHHRLERLRTALEADHISDEPEEDSSGELAHVDQHPADVASDAFEREKSLSILEQVQAELADVDRALQRIDEGTYGRCEACGDAIADERLAVVPAARFCLDHQADLET